MSRSVSRVSPSRGGDQRYVRVVSIVCRTAFGVACVSEQGCKWSELPAAVLLFRPEETNRCAALALNVLFSSVARSLAVRGLTFHPFV